MAQEDAGQQRDERLEEAEEMARLQEQINNLPVSEHLLYMLHSLSSLAVDRLGLMPEAATRKDVRQAKLAIDAFKALLGVLEEARPTEEIAAHRGVLSQLQLAYVGALSGSVPTDEAGDAEGEVKPAEAPGDASSEQTSAQSEVEPEAATPKSANKGADKGADKSSPKAGAKNPSKPNARGKDSTESDGSAAAKGGKKST